MSRNQKPVGKPKPGTAASKSSGQQMMSGRGNGAQRKQQQDLSDEENFFEDDNVYEIGANGEENTQGDLNNDFQEASDQGNKGADKKETVMVEEREADIPWDDANFWFGHVFDLSETVKNSGKGALSVVNGGQLSASVANRILKVDYHSHANDFIKLEKPADKDMKKKANLSCGVSKSDAKKKSSAQAMMQEGESLGDIVKSVTLEGFNMKGYEGPIMIHLKSIPKFLEEGHPDGTSYVSFRIKPHMWKTGQPIVIFDRAIRDSMMQFQENFPGMTPENLMAEVHKAKFDSLSMPINHPIIAMINAQKAAIAVKNDLANVVVDGEYKNPSQQATETVLVPRALFKKFKPQALDAMKKGLSYANISDSRFEVAFELPVPSHLQAHHDEFIESKGLSGRQFLGWADTAFKANPYALGSALPDIRNTDLLFKDPLHQSVYLEGNLAVKYKRQIKPVTEEDDEGIY